MRPSHQNNKRMRGRNRGGKGPNPLSRSYESNGPDVKIRGTAQHIAEKYLQLGRDAHASGDPVMAENYLQHAEHYLRLIAAAQEQFRQQNPSYRPFEVGGEEGDDDGEEAGSYGGGPQPDVRFPGVDGDEYQPQPQQQHRQNPQREPREWQPREQREPREWQPRGEGPQPREPREPREWQPREPRGDFQPREQREPRGDFQPRDGQQRRDDRFGRRGPRPDRPDFRGDRPERGERPERQDRPERQERPERAPVVEEEAGSALPAFITAPVRTAVPVEDERTVEAVESGAPAGDEETGRFPLRQRRRRAPRLRQDEGADAPVPSGEPAAE